MSESPTARREAPIDRAALDIDEGREAALDRLREWVVDELAGTTDDDRARDVLRVAITTFYDVREAGDFPRGMYEGHFFMVDGVGGRRFFCPRLAEDSVRVSVAPGALS